MTTFNPFAEECAVGAFTVAKSDVTVFNPVTRALYVGGSGDVAVRMASGDLVTFVSVPAGSILPIHCDKVLAATTATSLVGLV